jgi:hypothetical protein
MNSLEDCLSHEQKMELKKLAVVLKHQHYDVVFSVGVVYQLEKILQLIGLTQLPNDSGLGAFSIGNVGLTGYIDYDGEDSILPVYNTEKVNGVPITYLRSIIAITNENTMILNIPNEILSALKDHSYAIASTHNH